MNDWKPIKTAPKDGKEVILFGDVLTYCCSPSDTGDSMGYAVAVGRWRVQRWWTGLYEIIPTHWMPMPEPPVPK